jgi:hypothetical protein
MQSEASLLFAGGLPWPADFARAKKVILKS